MIKSQFFWYIQFTNVIPNDLPLYSFHAAERVNDMDSARYLTLQLGQCLSAQFLCIPYDVHSWQQCDKYVISRIFSSLFQSHIMSALAPTLAVIVLLVYWFLELWNIHIIQTTTSILIMKLPETNKMRMLLTFKIVYMDCAKLLHRHNTCFVVCKKELNYFVAYLHNRLHQSVNKWTGFVWLGKKLMMSYLSMVVGFWVLQTQRASWAFEEQQKIWQ